MEEWQEAKPDVSVSLFTLRRLQFCFGAEAEAEVEVEAEANVDQES